MYSEAGAGTAAQQWQKALGEGWAKALQSFQSIGAMGPGTGAATPASLPALRFTPAKLQAVQQQYLQEATALWTRTLQGAGAPASAAATPAAVPDRRFAGDAWAANPITAMAVAAYQLNAQALQGLADAVEADDKTRARIRFAVDQWAAATAPSNFLALNADAQQKAIATRGRSIAQGLRNMLHDLSQGHVSQTDESVFEVGRNVATTEGAVVFENELFQLLEYHPLTPQVFERPLLLVPPCINKFYILDLQPENSLIRHAVATGHRTFVISWRNPDASMAHKTWDDYIDDAVIRAIDTVRAITGQDGPDGRINTLGFCVGGTMLGTALAVLAARAEAAAGAEPPVAPVRKARSAAKGASATSASAAARNRASASARAEASAGSALPVASATFLTTFLDFSETGVLDLFIDEAFVRYRETQFANGGLMAGQDLASTFSFLRPNDLVWNYVVGNYLKGETPPPFDLLYWNGDSTNLPGPWYAWYLRNTYLENRLVQPGGCSVAGVPVDLNRVDVPAYIYGSREDHIVPIGTTGGGAYASTRVLPGPKRFVMGASGHIAGVINPPAKKKRSYWKRDDGVLPPTLGAWLEGAVEQPGSWWDDWTVWLQGHAGRKVAAPKDYGNAHYAAIEPAPGRYVKKKAK